jgi:hypothetical protein
MPRHNKITFQLTDRHLAAFNALVVSRRFSTDVGVEWLAKRGYLIGRSSVGLYAKHFRASAGRDTATAPVDRPGLKRALGQFATAMNAADLVQLVRFARFLMNEKPASGEKGRERSFGRLHRP